MPRLRKALSEAGGRGSAQPIRTCIGCRVTRPQDELIRLHLDDGGRLRIGRTGPGRGAWLCRATPATCLAIALDRRALDRAMRRPVDRASIDVVAVDLRCRQDPAAVSSPCSAGWDGSLQDCR